MPKLVPVKGKDEIAKSVALMAETLSLDYKNKKLVLIGVLKGAFMFLSDLARQLTIPAQIDFVGVSSYGDQTSSTGEIQFTKHLDLDIYAKHVLIIEDIVDTGLTLRQLKAHLETFHPASVKICTLVDKRERRAEQVAVDYACHIVPRGFLVGYGMDYAENYRHLPALYDLIP